MLASATQLREIHGHAFQNCSSVAEVSLGRGITKIGHGAFAGCIMLAHVTLPNSITASEAHVTTSLPFSKMVPNIAICGCAF